MYKYFKDIFSIIFFSEHEITMQSPQTPMHAN